MKGTGTVRRMLLGAAALLGRGLTATKTHSPHDPRIDHPGKPLELGAFRLKRGGTLQRPNEAKRTVQRPRAKGIFVTWGDCPARLSRKQLKRLAPTDPLVLAGWR